MDTKDIIKQIEDQLMSTGSEPAQINQGNVLSVGDGIVQVVGISKAGFGEEVEFEDGSKGLVFNLDEDFASIILLSNTLKIKEGMQVKTTGKILGIEVTEEFIGRVINPLGEPLDGRDINSKSDKGKIYPLEKIAPGVIEREPVDTPLKTGVKAVDSMTPIGRGQRELIIGDRTTGKTTIALDTIINQKKKDLGLKQVICIYCTIGQKRGSVARIINILEENDAMDYTIIVASTASDPASLQFLAPFAATAIGEYFMDKGKDVLIVYDDLSKHAWAYRQMSLLIRRPAGREAYPGDIFYLHSRLLERSARMSQKKGGGSITSLPIIETQANDVSSYIPTNVISITDGQIYLETDLFNSGIKPAVNVGLSVSRVGGAAQSKAMKQVAGPLRLEMAQFRDLAAFAQFGSDLDEITSKKIERGKRVTEVLKQSQFNPQDEVSEVVSIYAATQGLLDDLAVDKISSFEEKLITYMRVKHKKLIGKISTGEKMGNETTDELKKAIEEFKKTFSE